MNIKSETRWAIVNTRNNVIWLHYIGYNKREVISKFMEDEPLLTWKEFSRIYKWDCIKVKINFEQINKK